MTGPVIGVNLSGVLPVCCLSMYLVEGLLRFKRLAAQAVHLAHQRGDLGLRFLEHRCRCCADLNLSNNQLMSTATATR